MAYAETEDLSLSAQRLIELTDSEDAPGEQDDALLDLLEAESERIVDTYLAPTGKTPFPVDDVPGIITTITAWIWAYRIYRHREVMEIPKPIADDYAMAFQLMDRILANSSLLDPPADAFAGVPRVHSSSPRGWTHRGRHN